MQILTSRGVRIAIVFGSPLNNSQRWSFSFSCTEVSFRIATMSHSELFLCWWPSDVLKNPCLSSPALLACLNTHFSPICIHFWLCSVSIVVGVNNQMRIPFDTAPFWKWGHTGFFDFADGLVPLGRFPSVSLVPTPFKCLLVLLEGERDIVISPFPSLFKSCSRLHDFPRLHWFFTGH